MSIRLLAKDLYRLQQQIDKLTKEMEGTPFDQREHLQARLRVVRAERDHLRRVLDGQKDTPTRP